MDVEVRVRVGKLSKRQITSSLQQTKTNSGFL